MAKKVVVVPKLHQWGWYVKYRSSNDEERSLSGSVYAERIEWVERYFRRKFTRIAKELGEVTVWDEGLTSTGDDLLNLREQPDGTIVASTTVTDEFVCQENPNGTRSALPMPMSTPNRPMLPNMGIVYVPPPPAPVFPTLDTYKEAFDLVPLPKELHTHGGVNPGFKAKFYEVFPREK